MIGKVCGKMPTWIGAKIIEKNGIKNFYTVKRNFGHIRTTVSPLQSNNFGIRFSSTSSSEQQPPKRNDDGLSTKETGKIAFYTVGGVIILSVGLYFYSKDSFNSSNRAKSRFTPTYNDYNEVYKAIADKLVQDDDHDDGSYGPVLVRLAWHVSGTYNKNDGTGGSYGGTMRYASEQADPENAGLGVARNFLQSIHDKFPWISYGDLWTLGGVVSIQQLGGPTIKWRPGRVDCTDESKVPPNGRLPHANLGVSHVHDVFNRLGFTDQETVALIGAHALGRCHTNASGYDGPWTFSPTFFSNQFFVELVNNKWEWKKWDGKKQYEDKKTKSLMMLPTDMALVQAKEFKKWVEIYAKDDDRFRNDFAVVFSKLLELGVPFKPDQPQWTFPVVESE